MTREGFKDPEMTAVSLDDLRRYVSHLGAHVSVPEDREEGAIP